jgi:hypothetical protein
VFGDTIQRVQFADTLIPKLEAATQYLQPVNPINNHLVIHIVDVTHYMHIAVNLLVIVVTCNKETEVFNFF